MTPTELVKRKERLEKNLHAAIQKEFNEFSEDTGLHVTEFSVDLVDGRTLGDATPRTNIGLMTLEVKL